LFIEYAQAQTKTTAEVTDDVVKKHPVFISTVDKLKKEKAEEVRKATEQLETFKKEVGQKETFSKVSSKAIEIFNSFKPILSKDPVKAKNQMDDFIAKLNGYEYRIQDGDRIVILKDGKPLEDEHGHAKSFDIVVKETADRYFDFLVTDPERSSTNNGKDKDGNPLPTKKEIKVPQNEKEYAKMIGDQSIPLEDRLKMKEAYTKAKETV
jgi:hypothetical protein